MRMVIFFVYLAFLLIGGNDRVFAGNQNRQVFHYRSHLISQKQQTVSSGHASNLDKIEDFVVVDDENIIVGEDDDETNDDLVQKKSKSFLFYHLRAFPRSAIADCSKCHKHPPYFRGQISYKYIALGTFRV